MGLGFILNNLYIGPDGINTRKFLGFTFEVYFFRPREIRV